MPLLSSLASAASFLGVQLPWMVASVSGTATVFTSGSFKTAVWYGSGSFNISGLSGISNRNTVQLIICAGGGGGRGSSNVSGGGGGGVLRNDSYTLTSTGTQTVTVGAGGASDTNGGNSSFAGIAANGGGTGGTPGGCGGGAPGYSPQYTAPGYDSPAHGGQWPHLTGHPSGPSHNFQNVYNTYQPGKPGTNHGAGAVPLVSAPGFIVAGVGSQFGSVGGASGHNPPHHFNPTAAGGGGGGAAGLSTAIKGRNGEPAMSQGANPFNSGGHGGEAYWSNPNPSLTFSGWWGGAGGGGYLWSDPSGVFGGPAPSQQYHLGGGGGGGVYGQRRGGCQTDHDASGGGGSNGGGHGGRSNNPHAPGPHMLEPGSAHKTPHTQGHGAAGPGTPTVPWRIFGAGGGGGGGGGGGSHVCCGEECQNHFIGPHQPPTSYGGIGSGGVVILKWQYQA